MKGIICLVFHGLQDRVFRESFYKLLQVWCLFQDVLDSNFFEELFNRLRALYLDFELQNFDQKKQYICCIRNSCEYTLLKCLPHLIKDTLRKLYFQPQQESFQQILNNILFLKQFFQSKVSFKLKVDHKTIVVWIKLFSKHLSSCYLHLKHIHYAFLDLNCYKCAFCTFLNCEAEQVIIHNIWDFLWKVFILIESIYEVIDFLFGIFILLVRQNHKYGQVLGFQSGNKTLQGLQFFIQFFSFKISLYLYSEAILCLLSEANVHIYPTFLIIFIVFFTIYNFILQNLDYRLGYFRSMSLQINKPTHFPFKSMDPPILKLLHLYFAILIDIKSLNDLFSTLFRQILSQGFSYLCQLMQLYITIIIDIKLFENLLQIF